MRAEEHAAAHFDIVAGDPERVEAPGQPEDHEEEDQHPQHDKTRDEPQIVLPDVIDRVATLVLLPLGEPGKARRQACVAQVRDDEADHDDEEESAAQHRGQRMQPVPFAC